MKHHTKSVITALRLLCIALSVMLIVTMIPMSGFGRVHAEPKDYELKAAEEQAENAAPLQEENAAPLQEENAAPLRQAEDDQETDPDADQETGPDADQNRETEEAATLPNVKGAGDDDTDGTDDTDVTSDPFTEFWDEESGSYILESGTYTLAEDFVAQ